MCTVWSFTRKPPEATRSAASRAACVSKTTKALSELCKLWITLRSFPSVQEATKQVITGRIQ